MDEFAGASGEGGVTSDGVEALYRRHFHDVLRSVLPVVGRMALAEEVVQDAFEAANRDWARVSRYDRPDLWVRRVALNKAISVMRRSTRETLVRQPEEHAFDGDDWSPDSAAVVAALRTLSDRQIEVTVLVYFGGLRVAEAARALGLSESTARTHHQRALDALAPLLGDNAPTGLPKREGA